VNLGWLTTVDDLGHWAAFIGRTREDSRYAQAQVMYVNGGIA
jgi:hypothetical protein